MLSGSELEVLGRTLSLRLVGRLTFVCESGTSACEFLAPVLSYEQLEFVEAHEAKTKM